MASTTTKPDLDATTPFSGAGMPAWPRNENENESASALADYRAQDSAIPSQRDALQALLAFSALHEQLRRRKALALHQQTFDAGAPVAEFTSDEQFVLAEVLQLVAERAIAITGADGLAIALAENNEIVLRAAAGTVRPDIGARIDRDSAFSGACFRTAQTVNCDDTETDPRVNLEACRKLGARSMVAVPLCGRRRVIGLLEAFSAWPFGFNDTDVRNLTLLAELVLGALKPEDEDRFAESAQAAVTKLETASPEKTSVEPLQPVRPVPASAAPTIAAPTPSTPVSAASTAPVCSTPPALVVPFVEKIEKKPIEAKPVSVPAKTIQEKPATEPAPKLEKVVTRGTLCRTESRPEARSRTSQASCSDMSYRHRDRRCICRRSLVEAKDRTTRQRDRPQRRKPPQARRISACEQRGRCCSSRARAFESHHRRERVFRLDYRARRARPTPLQLRRSSRNFPESPACATGLPPTRAR